MKNEQQSKDNFFWSRDINVCFVLVLQYLGIVLLYIFRRRVHYEEIEVKYLFVIYPSKLVNNIKHPRLYM